MEPGLSSRNSFRRFTSDYSIYSICYFITKCLKKSIVLFIFVKFYRYAGYSSVRNDYGVQALAPTITLEFYLMSFHFIQKENLIQENKALSLRLKIIYHMNLNFSNVIGVILEFLR